jgi:uncharacterized protein (DUF433 family)
VAEVREGRTYYGNVWADGEYREPVYANPLSIRVGEAGIKVWMIISYLQSRGGDVAAVLERYAPLLTEADIDAAISYYVAHKSAIDEKLEEEAHV